MAYQSEGDELADRGLRPMNLDGGFTPGNADALLKINKNADDILNKSHISGEEVVNLLDMEQDQLALDDLINNYKLAGNSPKKTKKVKTILQWEEMNLTENFRNKFLLYKVSENGLAREQFVQAINPFLGASSSRRRGKLSRNNQ